MRVCYLIQGAAKVLADFPFPVSDDIFLAAYDRPFERPGVRECHFIPKTTWAQGRNLLVEKALTAGAYDYFVFCDDDVRFASGDLAAFEAALRKSQPLVGLPLMTRASRKGLLLSGQDVQRAVVIDEQLMAVHRSLIGRLGISPIVTDYDDVSWWISCRILESILVRDHHPYIHQYNGIVVRNEVHRFKDDGATIDGGTSTYATASAGTDEESFVAAWFAKQNEPYQRGMLKRMVRPQRKLSLRRAMYHWTVEPELKKLAADWRPRPGAAA